MCDLEQTKQLKAQSFLLLRITGDPRLRILDMTSLFLQIVDFGAQPWITGSLRQTGHLPDVPATRRNALYGVKTRTCQFFFLLRQLTFLQIAHKVKLRIAQIEFGQHSEAGVMFTQAQCVSWSKRND